MICKYRIFPRREVSKDEAMDFAKENNLMYIETSAKTGSNVKKAFMKLIKRLYNKTESENSSSDFKKKAEIP